MICHQTVPVVSSIQYPICQIGNRLSVPFRDASCDLRISLSHENSIKLVWLPMLTGTTGWICMMTVSMCVVYNLIILNANAEFCFCQWITLGPKGSSLFDYSSVAMDTGDFNMHWIVCDALGSRLNYPYGKIPFQRTSRPLWYERVYLPLCKVADTLFHIQGNEVQVTVVVIPVSSPESMHSHFISWKKTWSMLVKMYPIMQVHGYRIRRYMYIHTTCMHVHMYRLSSPWA